MDLGPLTKLDPRPLVRRPAQASRTGARRAATIAGGAAGAAGAALMYLFDPDVGNARRTRLRDQGLALVRRRGEGVDKARRYAQGQARGVVHKATTLTTKQEAPPNDETLVAKVESEVLRGADYPKGKINVNAEGGVVVLRGEVDHPDQLTGLEQAVAKVAGVRGVRSLLHLPGTPPPNKEDALRTT